MLSNHAAESSFRDEISPHSHPKIDSKSAASIPIKKSIPDLKALLAYAMKEKKFHLLQVYLLCSGADQALDDFLGDSYFQRIFIGYLFFQKDPKSFVHAIHLLKQCRNGNKIISLLHDNVLFIKETPLIHYAISQKHYLLLKIILKSNKVDDLLKFATKNMGTPLEHAKNDKKAQELILQVLAKNNPFAEAVIGSKRESLAKLLHKAKPQLIKEAKLPQKPIQHQLQIAGICSQVLGQLWDIDLHLFRAGMEIYPINPYYRTSFLYHILSNNCKNKELQSELIRYCLHSIKKLEDPVKTKALQESRNNKNLLELAYEKQNDEVIIALKEAGATLPDEAKPLASKRDTILIQSIKEKKIDYFKSHIHMASPLHLIQTAKYCIEQYDEKNSHDENNIQIKECLKILLIDKEQTLSDKGIEESLTDFALRLDKLSLIPLLEDHGIQFSEISSSVSAKENKYENTVDVLSRYVLNGKLNSLKLFLEKQSEQRQKAFINNTSSQGLTLAEIAVIHEQWEIFAFLVCHPAYNKNKNGVFDILDPPIINQLLVEQFKKVEHTKLRGLLEVVRDNYPIDYRKPIIDPLRESPILNSFCLKRMIMSIMKGQLDVSTFEKLARKKRPDDNKGFKDKFAAYLQRLDGQNPE